MGKLAGSLRDILRMARVLREAAALTRDPIYIAKFHRAAAELEHRARELAGMEEGEALPDEENADALHAPVDVRV